MTISHVKCIDLFLPKILPTDLKSTLQLIVKEIFTCRMVGYAPKVFW